MTGTLTKDGLRKLAAEWIAAGKTVIGPVKIAPGKLWFTRLASADELVLDGWFRPANSIKEAVFPRHEPLYSYRIAKDSIELKDPAGVPEQIVIGAHPCDAASLEILDAIFNWDYRDDFYNRRRAVTTVISIACASHDEHCFCTSVGLAPDATRGSDAMLVERGDGSFSVHAITDKGRAIAPGAGEAAGVSAAAPAPERKFDPAVVAEFARTRFDDPFWAGHALACLGCGACAYTCPVCHCFDIADEGNGRTGERSRNWDACQFPLFTLHASGHNPRRTQGERQRQRIFHKFVMYPEKFGEILCTGCGNCSRSCPVGLGILPVVGEIAHAKSV